MTTILSKIVSTRTSIPFLRNSIARTAIKVDVNRHCVDMALHGNIKGSNLTEVPVELSTDRPNFDALNDVVGDCASSLIVSWPDTETPRSALLKTLEGTLKEFHTEVCTTRPFFMLDGGGRRMASLTLVGSHQDHKLSAVDTAVLSQYDYQVPAGTWIRQFSSSLRATATSS
jgi:hypothetical protein